VHQLYLGIKKAYDSVSREVLSNTVIEFVLPMKIKIETKEYPNKKESEVLLRKHLFVLKYFLLRMVYKKDILHPISFKFGINIRLN
jgi:hypothetical protein